MITFRTLRLISVRPAAASRLAVHLGGQHVVAQRAEVKQPCLPAVHTAAARVTPSLRDQRLSEVRLSGRADGPSGNIPWHGGTGVIIIRARGRSLGDAGDAGDAGDDSLRWKSVINKDSQIPIGGNHPLQETLTN